MKNNKNLLWLPTAIASLSALYAAIGHPSEYGFYTLARISVTTSAIILAYNLIDSENKQVMVACIATAVIFNPFIPLNLGRQIWAILDLVAVVLLIIATVSATKNSTE